MKSPFAKTPIAIVGMGCRLPGADGLEEFWEMLRHGQSAIQELPQSFIDRELYFDQKKGVLGKSYSTIGGLIKERPLDLDLCPVSREDLQSSDPAHLVMCEVAASACHHAGYDPRDLQTRNAGVFLGHSAGSNYGSEIVFGSLLGETLDYLRDVPGFSGLPASQQDAIIAEVKSNLCSGKPTRNSEGGPHVGANIASSLVARTLGLTGPHFVIDAACASSLVALAVGAMAVQRGDIDMAIIGGASVNKPESLILFSHAQSCSATGSRPFDDEADGLIGSEGYVAMLIKTLPRAIAEGDTIHAVIPGIGISTDGRGRSLWAPSKDGQMASMRNAYGSHLNPSALDFVEAHATSTQVGDATEMEALAEFFGPFLGSREIPIGSIKSNIGHTLETAGIAGVLKAILSFKNNLVPPTINVTSPNRTVPWEQLPFRIATEPVPLLPHSDGRPRRAAIDAFGIGGLNVHVVLDEYVAESKSFYNHSEAVKSQVATNLKSDEERIALAVIGRGCILPGAHSIDQFRNQKTQVIASAPNSRWRKQIGVETGVIGPGKSPHCRGGFITDYEFDWMRYRIPPKQVANANPLQFMLLDATRQALREAGMEGDEPKVELDRSRTGVVVGTIFGGEFGHQLLMGLRLPEVIRRLHIELGRTGLSAEQIQTIATQFRETILKHKPALVDETGSFTSSTLASRVSKELDLRGGAMAIDAGECSSLAALNVAASLLQSKNCDYIVCAGAQRSMDLANFEILSLQGKLQGSDPGNLQNGFVPGEGVVTLLVTTLEHARENNIPVLSVIHGTGGAFDSVSVANSVSLAANRAINISSRSDVQLSDRTQAIISGNSVQDTDREESYSLKERFPKANHSNDQQHNIDRFGHLLAAQGLVSVLGETLATGSQGVSAINGRSFDGQSFHVLMESERSLLAANQDRVDETSDRVAVRTSASSCARIYRVSAASPVELENKLRTVSQKIRTGSTADLDRERFDNHESCRVAIVAESQNELGKKIELASQRWNDPKSQNALAMKGIFSRAGNSRTRKTAFLFPGQGSQYRGMLKGLVDGSPAAQEVLEEANSVLRELRLSTFEETVWDETSDLDQDPWNTQISVLLADAVVNAALAEAGIRPDIVCGHSFGEIPALIASGSLTISQAIQLTRFRTEAICQSDYGDFRSQGLLSVQAMSEEIEEALQQFNRSQWNGREQSQLYVTHYNSVEQVVVGGDVDELTRFKNQIEQKGRHTQMLNVSRAFHTPLMQRAANTFAESLQNIGFKECESLFLSSVNNQYTSNPRQIRDLLARQLVEPVQFVDLVNHLVDDGFGILVEVGPQRVLTGLARQICAGKDVICVATDNRRNSSCPRSAQLQLLQIQAILECEGTLNPRQISHAIDNTAKTSTFLPAMNSNKNIIKQFDATRPRRERLKQNGVSTFSHNFENPSIKASQRPALFDATANRRSKTRNQISTQTTEVGNGLGRTEVQQVDTLDISAKQEQSVASAAPSSKDDSLQAFLVDFVVEATGYPASIIDIDWEFEADLGIDSIKKAQMFGELREFFDLDAKADQFMDSGKLTLDRFKTLRDVLDLLRECDGKGDWLSANSTSRSNAVPSLDSVDLTEHSISAAADLPANISSPDLTMDLERGSKAEKNGLADFLIDFVIEQTGYPREIIELDAEFEADLGIDSIKKAQLFGELREHFALDMKHFETMDRNVFGEIRSLRDAMDFLQNLPGFDSELAALDSTETRPPLQSARTIASSVVETKELQPIADSNIRVESISEVEPPVSRDSSGEFYAEAFLLGQQNRRSICDTLSSLVGRFELDLSSESPIAVLAKFSKNDIEKMQGLADGAGVHIGNIAAFNLILRNHQEIDVLVPDCLNLDSLSALGANTGQTPANAKATLAANLDRAKVKSTTSRYVMRTKVVPQNKKLPPFPQLNGNSIILGINDTAVAIKNQIEEIGGTAHCIDTASGQKSAMDELDRIWQQAPVPHLFIATARDPAAQSTWDWSQWVERREQGIMTIFWFCQRWLKLIEQNELMDDASLIGITSSDGEFGFQSPVHAIEGGGIAGLIKAVFIESWVNNFRTTPFKVIDAVPNDDAQQVAEFVLRELVSPIYDTEVALKQGERRKVQAVAQPVAPKIPRTPIPRGSHWICTGGARGITAFVCHELANRYGLKLSLIGTTPHVSIPEHWHSSDESVQKQIKLETMTSARNQGKNPIKAWERVEKEIEIDKTLRELKAAGIDANYYTCDVADLDALKAVLTQARQTSGPIDGILHGAGIGKDARFENKKEEKVRQCVGAKVDGALSLMIATRNDPLKYFVGFGSISGRFGANGHTDYSLANDMLAKSISWFRGQRPDVASVAFHWHAWGDVGMATKPETRLALEMIDMDFMPAREGLQHLIDELEIGAPESEILITDDRYYRLFYPGDSLDNDAVNLEATHHAEKVTPYPMLERGELTEREGKEFISIPLDPVSDPFLAEHRLDDRPLLPIVVGIELLAEAGCQKLGSGNGISISNIEAYNGLKFFSDDPQTVHVGSNQVHNGEVQCTLSADFLSRNGKLVEADRRYLGGKVGLIDLDRHDFRKAVKAPGGEWHPVKYPKPGSKFYLGPALQRLRKIKIVGQKAWGKIIAPATVELAGPRISGEGWLVPSAAMDACLFTTGLLAWFSIKPGSALPAGIGELVVGRMPAWGEPCLVESTFKLQDGRYAYFDFSLYGNDGSPLLEVTDYRIVWLT